MNLQDKVLNDAEKNTYEYANTIEGRVSQIIDELGGKNQAEIAERLEISKTPLRSTLNAGRINSPEHDPKYQASTAMVVKVHEQFGVSLNWLMSGRGMKFSQDIALPIMNFEDALLYLLDNNASRLTIDNPAVNADIEMLTINSGRIFSHYGAEPEDLIAFSCESFIMEPTLEKGDIVLLNKARCRAKAALQLIQTVNYSGIFRVFPKVNGDLILSVDNKEHHEDYQLIPKDVWSDTSKFKILGTVLKIIKSKDYL